MNNELLIKNSIDKLEKESKEAKISNKAGAVLPHVKRTLIAFVKQEPEFAQAIIECKKSLSDCCAEIMKDVGNSVSDLEVYKAAVNFYFQGATVEFNMKIKLFEENQGKTLNVSLMDLLDI